jgi:hypothetical protein
LLLTADDIALLTTADGRRLRLSELPSGVHEHRWVFPHGSYISGTAFR